MLVLKDKNIPVGNWNSLVKNNPYSSPFQTPAFFDFYNSVPGFSAEAIAISDKGTISALAVITLQQESGLKSHFSRRAIIYGGPLVDPNYSDSIAELLIQIQKSTANRQIYIEIRNLSDYGSVKSVFGDKGWKYIPYFDFYIDLKNKTRDYLISNMAYNRRRQIQNSLKEGASVSECENERELKALYLILSELYLNRVKLPLPRYEFFKNFWNQKIGPVFIVKHNENIIGGSFCPVLEGEVIYTLYYCGSRNYSKKIFPTHLTIMGAMEYGLQNGLNKLDFMGAGKPGSTYGVRNYKKEFGGILVEHGRYLKVMKPVLYQIGKLGLYFLKKLA